MRDGQRGSAATDALQCRLHQAFTLRIQGAGGLVQQQDRPIPQDRPRQCDPGAPAVRFA